MLPDEIGFRYLPQDRELPDLREGRNSHCEAVLVMLYQANRDAINETEKVLFHYQNILGKLHLKVNLRHKSIGQHRNCLAFCFTEIKTVLLVMRLSG